MALRIVSPDEFADRVTHLLGLARVSARALSLEMEEREDFVSYWLNRKRSGAPKRIDPEVASRLANRLAGRERVIDDELQVFHFLMGIDNDYAAVVRSTLRPVDGDDGPGLPNPAYLMAA